MYNLEIPCDASLKTWSEAEKEVQPTCWLGVSGHQADGQHEKDREKHL